jgi:hypothetical protein
MANGLPSCQLWNEAASTAQIVLVFNLFEDLRRVAPVRLTAACVSDVDAPF